MNDLSLIHISKHGGANIKVTQMFEDMKEHLSDWEDRDAAVSYTHLDVYKRQVLYTL